MTPDERRAKIMSLLSQCRIDETERLHSGRAVIPAQPIAYYAEKIEALFMPGDSLLDRLWGSSTDLLDRFGAQPSVGQAIDRMMKEVVELIVAAHDTYGSSTNDIAEEAGDVLVTAINVLRAACVTKEQFGAALQAIIAKNNKKNPDTHQLDIETQGVEKIGKVKS